MSPSLQELPEELIACIGQFLDKPSLLSFQRTCRWVHMSLASYHIPVKCFSQELFLCVLHDKSAYVSFYLTHRPCTGLTSPEDSVAFCTAADRGYVETLDAFLTHGGPISEELLYVAFKKACLGDHTACVQRLLGRLSEFPPSAGVSEEKSEAVRVASSTGCMDGLRLFLRGVAGEHPVVRTAFFWASIGCHTECLRFLLPLRPPPRGCLTWLCSYGHVEGVRLLIAHTPPVGREHKEALYWASIHGFTDIVQCLLDATPSPSASMYALTFASIYGHDAMVRHLLETPHVKAGTHLGYPLWKAIEKGHTPTVRCLLEHGAPLRAEHLVTAAEKGPTPTLAFLLQSRPDLVDDAFTLASRDGCGTAVDLLSGPRPFMG